MTYSWRNAIIGFGILSALHGLVAFTAGNTISWSMNMTLLATNLFVLHIAFVVLNRANVKILGLFLLGYFILFVLLLVFLDRKPLFILSIILYASVFRSSFLLGCFVILLLSFVVFQPFAFESFVPLLLIYIVWWKVRKQNRFLQVCLLFGLVSLGLVLLPLIHLSIQDSAQTLWHVLLRPDVQEALWISIASSTIATLLIAIWGIPLAYALARLNFTGKQVVESIIDVPILIPQSVVGISFMILFGPRSVLGDTLNDWFNLQVTGRFIGIVLAQIFVASPFLIKTALTAFSSVPLQLENASRTLGASSVQTFYKIALPLASRGIFIGMILAWARAISEFGSIMLFASTPISSPILVHTEFLRAGVNESRPIAILLLLTCLWIFLILQFGKSLLPFGLGKQMTTK